MISRELKINNKPVTEIRAELIDKYYSKNDRQHMIDHIDTVWDNAKNIILEDIINGYAESVYGKIDDRFILMLWTAVYHHDIMCWKDRKRHHDLAGEYIIKDKDLRKEFSSDEIMMIYHAVTNHRASERFPAINYGYLTEVMRTADRGVPSLEAVMQRSNLLIMRPDEEAFKLLEHLMVKYGPSGYAFANDQYYSRRFEKEIKQLEDDMVKVYRPLLASWMEDETIDKDLLLKYVNKIDKHLVEKGVEL